MLNVIYYIVQCNDSLLNIYIYIYQMQIIIIIEFIKLIMIKIIVEDLYSNGLTTQSEYRKVQAPVTYKFVSLLDFKMNATDRTI